MSKCQNCQSAGKHAFCSLGVDARDFLESESVGVEYPRGTVLFREGDQCDAIFVVCSGKIKVSVSSREGRTMILRIADAGDVLGMSAALGNEPFEVTAESLEPSRVRVLHLKSNTKVRDVGLCGAHFMQACAMDPRVRRAVSLRNAI